MVESGCSGSVSLESGNRRAAGSDTRLDDGRAGTPFATTAEAFLVWGWWWVRLTREILRFVAMKSSPSQEGRDALHYDRGGVHGAMALASSMVTQNDKVGGGIDHEARLQEDAGIQHRVWMTGKPARAW
jgi:hypothetical protein